MKFVILMALLAVAAANDYKSDDYSEKYTDAPTTEEYKSTSAAYNKVYRRPVTTTEQYNKASYAAKQEEYKPARGNYKTAEREYEEEYEPVVVPYSFGYDVKDSEHYTDFDHSQKSDGKVVTGSYRIALPDGRTQIVTYKADSYGFNADVTYEGEAIYPEEEESDNKSSKAASYYAEQKENKPYPAENKPYQAENKPYPASLRTK